MKDILLKSSLIKKIDHEKSILRTETHLHLYGCLDAAGLYDIGKDRYLNFSDRMDWFATEYEKVNGIRPDYRKWWASSQGFDDFRETFEFTAPGTFDKFQSKFNLLIALNPPHFDDLQLAKRVLTKDQELACLREYRTFVPHYLDERSREKYLLNLLQVTKDFSQSRSGFRPLLALSLMRTNSECHAIYDWLTSFTNKHPWTVDFITGIDFCGSEVGHPPEDKISFLAQLNKDNESRTRPWGVLYHVGEMWDHMSLASSARWVLQAALQGITRLGHAMALGVEPSASIR
ncbi:MAG: hypothetical protein NTV34_03510 [Proteobacteria bacterium]|nr:hypothetical protein [Pseudomonadota bacterium]